MTVEQVPVARLSPHPENPRRGDVAAIGDSIAAHGWYGVIVAQRSTGRILAGNHRYQAALAAGIEDVPVWWMDVDDDEARRILLADNRTSDLASYDPSALLDLLANVDATDLRLDGTGWLEDDLADLVAASWQPDPTQPKDPGPSKPEEAQAIWKVETGDVWLAGRHRIVCGNAGDPAVAERAMATPAAMIWTDPPYGVNYQSRGREMTIAAGGVTVQHPVLSGDGAAAGGTLEAALRAWRGQGGAPLYCCAPAGPAGLALRLAITRAGWRYHQSLVWVKDRFVLGHSDYHFQHEDVLYGHAPGAGRPGRGKHKGTRWRGDHAQTSVFHIPRPAKSDEHPTQKPVDLIKPMLLNSSRAGETVYDPFAGSGSTVVACEQTGRACVAIDIDPSYVAVTLQRLAGLGLTPKREPVARRRKPAAKPKPATK